MEKSEFIATLLMMGFVESRIARNRYWRGKFCAEIKNRTRNVALMVLHAGSDTDYSTFREYEPAIAWVIERIQVDEQ